MIDETVIAGINFRHFYIISRVKVSIGTYMAIDLWDNRIIRYQYDSYGITDFCFDYGRP